MTTTPIAAGFLIDGSTITVGANNILSSTGGPSLPVSVSDGGTGLTSLTATGLLLGNGTSNVGFIIPGNPNSILTTSGGIWGVADRRPVDLGAGTLSTTGVSINVNPSSVGYYTSIGIVFNGVTVGTATTGLNILCYDGTPTQFNASYYQSKSTTPTMVANSTTGLWTTITQTTAQVTSGLIIINLPGAASSTASVGGITYSGFITGANTSGSDWTTASNLLYVYGNLLASGSSMALNALASIKLTINGTASFTGGSYIIYGIR